MRIGDIHKLQEKKYRKEFGLYIIQGEKSVDEACAAGIVQELFCIESLYGKYKKIIPQTHVVSQPALQQAGTQATADGVIALAECSYAPLTESELTGLRSAALSESVLVLDGISDPGNFGTIIRTADWFGIKHIVCSIGTVDVYNPKVIASTMGSFLRVRTHYTVLSPFLSSLKQQGSVIIGAVLDGEPLNAGALPHPAVLVMGSESHGLDADTNTHITKRVTIPRKGGAESLNVAVATAILLSHMDSWR
jgi:TrmH family RNA methyltransferase